MTRRARDFADIGLTACLLGLIACPLPFVVLSLPRIAARVILALLLAVAGIALIAYLSTPSRFPV